LAFLHHTTLLHTLTQLYNAPHTDFARSATLLHRFPSPITWCARQFDTCLSVSFRVVLSSSLSPYTPFTRTLVNYPHRSSQTVVHQLYTFCLLCISAYRFAPSLSLSIDVSLLSVPFLPIDFLSSMSFVEV